MEYLTKFPLVITTRALIVNEKNELLLVSHNWGKKSWYTPGGRLEANETLHQGVKREVFEETGLNIEFEKLVYVHEELRLNGDQDLHYFAFYFFIRVSETKLNIDWIDQGGQVNAAHFFSQDEASKNEHIYPPFLKDKFWKDLKNDFKDFNSYIITEKSHSLNKI